jgi:dTDP-glucose 4,6-dehydratase
VTGAAGFIGSNFARQYLQRHPDHKIVNLDKLTYAGKRENFSDLERKPNYAFVGGDIANRETVSKAMEGCDGVINFAAESHVDRSIEDALPFIRTNFEGTFNLLDEARKQDVKKFVQISTDEVYGEALKDAFSETTPLNPRNPYSASKTGADRLAYSFFTTYGMDVIVTRSSNNFGPYQFPEKMMSLFITNLLQGKKVPLYGNGKNVRDWLYVLDNCDAIETCFEKGKAGEAYNIGAGNEFENVEVTDKILSSLGKGKERIEYVKDRPGHDRRYSLNWDKIKNELGWNPTHDFENALKQTVEWYKNNEAWWMPLLKHQIKR